MGVVSNLREECLRRECGQKYPIGANFCPYCGLPVRQECPYDNCGAVVPNFTNGQPTTECPDCGRIYRYNPSTFRLFTDFDEVDPETQEPLVSPTVEWPHWFGNTDVARSIDTKYGKPFAETEGAQVGPAFPDRQLGPMIYGGARLIYFQDEYLIATSLAPANDPGNRRSTNCKLPSKPSPEPWRLAVGRGKVFVALANEVQIYENSNLHPIGSAIPGSFVQQIVRSDGRWFGLATTHDASTLVERAPAGETNKYDFDPVVGFMHHLLEFNGRPTVVTQEGEVFQLEHGQMRRIRPSVDGDRVLACAASTSALVALIQKPEVGYRLLIVSATGKGTEFTVPDATAVCPELVVFGDKVCLFPQKPDSVHFQPFDLVTLGFERSVPLGLQRLETAIGYSNGNNCSLVLAGASMGEGEIWAMNPVTMIRAKVGQFAQSRVSINLLIADRWIVVAHRGQSFKALLTYEM